MTTKNILNFSISLSCFLSLSFIFPSASQAAEIYVAPSGSDSNPGTLAAPLKTLPKAQELARAKIKKGLTENLTIFLRAGVYKLYSPLNFGTQDSGTNTHSVTYRAYNQESVRIHGGQLISNWTKKNNNIWVSPVINSIKSGTWTPKALYKNNKRLVVARHPNIKGNFPTPAELLMAGFSVEPEKATEIQFSSPLPSPIPNSPRSGIEIVALHIWSESTVPITARFFSKVAVDNPVGWQSRPGMEWPYGEPYLLENGDYVYLQNGYDFLDQPGEWYLDQVGGQLYYKAAAGEEPTGIFAPQLSELLHIEGTPDQKILNLHFQDLTFEFSNWTPPASGYTNLGNTTHIPGNHDEKGNPKYAVTPAISINHTQNSSFIHNNFRNLGGVGVGVGIGTNKLTFTHNEFRDIGSSCLAAGYPGTKQEIDLKDWGPANKANLPNNLTISDNDFSYCGASSPAGSAVFLNLAKNSVVSYNTVHDLPYVGISVNGKYIDDPSIEYAGNITVEHNKIYNVMNMFADGSAFYSHGSLLNSIVSNNLIYDVRRPAFVMGGPSKGLYFDGEGTTKGWSVNRNVIYNLQQSPPTYIGGKSHTLQTYGTNYLGITPAAPNFPTGIANLAGPRPYQPIPFPSSSSSPSSLPGDANGDNRVDGVDYVVWVTHYNQSVTGATKGDFNNSGKVDGVDYVVWVTHYSNN